MMLGVFYCSEKGQAVRRNGSRGVPRRRHRGNRNGSHRDRVGEPVRKEHGGQPHHGPEAEGERRGGLFPEGKHLHAGLQGRAAHYHHVLAGAGGEPEHFGKLHMEETEAACGRQGQPGLQLLPRLPERGGWADGGCAGRSGNGAAHLPDLQVGADALRHRKIPDGQEHPDAHRKGDLAARDGGEHPSDGGVHLPQRSRNQHGDLKPEAAGASVLCQMFPAAFSVCGNRRLLCMEICE